MRVVSQRRRQGNFGLQRTFRCWSAFGFRLYGSALDEASPAHCAELQPAEHRQFGVRTAATVPYGLDRVSITGLNCCYGLLQAVSWFITSDPATKG